MCHADFRHHDNKIRLFYYLGSPRLKDNANDSGSHGQYICEFCSKTFNSSELHLLHLAEHECASSE